MAEKKPKGTLFVTFRESTYQEILRFLVDNNLDGFQVSTLVDRWAVEVPAGKEKHFSEYLSKQPLVKRVANSYIEGRTKFPTVRK